MEIKEIDIDNPLYEETLDLRTKVISIPFGFPAPTKETETPGSHMFVAIDDNKIIGFAMITPSTDKKSIRARQVSVTPAKQKQGIGRMLMKQVELVAKSLGYDELCLYAHAGSYPFFLKLDYNPKDDWQIQENGLKTIFMSKKL